VRAHVGLGLLAQACVSRSLPLCHTAPFLQVVGRLSSGRHLPPPPAAWEAGGVAVAEWLSEDVLRRLFALLMLVVAGQLAWRVRRS